MSVRARRKSTPTMIPLGNKLLVALVVGAFVLDSTSALADDIESMPLNTMGGHEILAARAKAKTLWAKMTPGEKDRARKTAASRDQGELTALDEIARGGRGVDPWEKYYFREKPRPIKPKPLPPERPDKRDDGKKPSSD